MSSVKPVAAVAIAQLWEQGKIELDRPVADYLPAFAAHGKDRITVKHVLTHTGGFRNVTARWQSADWEELVSRVCEATPESDWVLGEDAGYHIASGWVVLGELVRVLDGRRFDVYARDAVFLPLGMNDSWAGMPPEQYRRYGPRLGTMYTTETQPARPAGLDGETQAALVRPGSNGRGPARELGRFYEALANGGGAILQPETVQRFTTRQRTGLHDQTFQAVLDWGYGFIIQTRVHPSRPMPYGYGCHASDRTFGHSGSQSSCGFCDPAHGLVVAWICNGMPGEQRHQARCEAINTAIYEDLLLEIS